MLLSRTSRIHLGHKIVTYSAAFFLTALSLTLFIEPKEELDRAMHIHEGRLPDIVILENQEPADVILKWGRLASKDHHPVVREPIYYDILAKVCNEIKHVRCKRWRAWEYIDMGSITVAGQSYKIDYFNPGVEPLGRRMCKSDGDGKVNKCLKRSADSICSRIVPQPTNCTSDLVSHMSSQLIEYESKRLDKKDTYMKLGLEMDAPNSELFPRMADLARRRGMNIVPFNTVGNKTSPVYHDWDLNLSEAYAARDAHQKIKDPESREWNDKPCTPYFGGALCAKHDKDGNMIIEV